MPKEATTYLAEKFRKLKAEGYKGKQLIAMALKYARKEHPGSIAPKSEE